MPAKKKTQSGKPDYESAFAELQEIVARLESGAPSLEESLALFERGQKLARVCIELLEKAELRIRELAVPGADPGSSEGPEEA